MVFVPGCFRGIQLKPKSNWVKEILESSLIDSNVCVISDIPQFNPLNALLIFKTFL